MRLLPEKKYLHKCPDVDLLATELRRFVVVSSFCENDVHFFVHSVYANLFFYRMPQRKIDVDSGKLKEFDFIAIIQDARKMEAPDSGTPTPTMSGTAPTQDATTDKGLDFLAHNMANFIANASEANLTLARNQSTNQAQLNELAKSQSKNQATVGALAQSHDKLARNTQAQLNELAKSQSKNQETVGALTQSHDKLAHDTQARFKQVAGKFETLAQSQHKANVRINEVDSANKRMDARVDHLEAKLSSTQKYWDDIFRAREGYDQGRQELGGCRLFDTDVESKPSANQSEVVLELDDITEEGDSYLMDTLLRFHDASFELTQLSADHQKLVRTLFHENLNGASPLSLAPEINDEDVLLLEPADPLELVKLPSLATFSEGLGENILAIPGSGDGSAVFVMASPTGFAIDDILQAVGGVQVQFIFAANDGDIQFFIYAPSAQRASSTFGALLQLAAKTPREKLELEPASFNQNESDSLFDLPLQNNIKEFYPFRLELKRFNVTPEQESPLTCFKGLKLEASELFDGGKVLVDVVVGGSHPLRSIECRNNLPIAAEPLLRLVKWLGKRQSSPFKVTFKHGEYKLFIVAVFSKILLRRQTL